MKNAYCIIPFFKYYKDDSAGGKKLVNMSRFIRSKEQGQPDIIQILMNRDGSIPKIDNGSRCICVKRCERYMETGQKVEEYEFILVLPTQVTLTWDDHPKHKCWSQSMQIGRNTVVYCPKATSKLPINGSSAEVKWEVKPFRVEYVSDKADFFIIKCQLVRELTSTRAKNRHLRKGLHNN